MAPTMGWAPSWTPASVTYGHRFRGEEECLHVNPKASEFSKAQGCAQEHTAVTGSPWRQPRLATLVWPRTQWAARRFPRDVCTEDGTSWVVSGMSSAQG